MSQRGLNRSFSDMYSKNPPSGPQLTNGSASQRKSSRNQRNSNTAAAARPSPASDSTTPLTSKRIRSEDAMEAEADKQINIAIQKQATLRKKLILEPRVTYEDFGGIAQVREEVDKMLIHFKHPELFKALGIEPPRGFLLHGPPGVGKTMLVEAIAAHAKVTCIRAAATELVTGISGESEAKVRDIFAMAASTQPSILFIDEIDAITPRRDQAAREMERRIVTQLLSSLDSLQDANVIVIGATNRPDSIDPALRRAGRFDREISVPIPDENSRREILQILMRGLRVEENFNHDSLAHRTPGYVGADLKSLIREASLNSLERFLGRSAAGTLSASGTTSLAQFSEDEIRSHLIVTSEDFNVALKQVQPSAKREGFATVPDVTWEDVGALEAVREELQMAILAPVRYQAEVKKLGLSISVGILLCGPPGCGKTLLAKAIANESGINFISVKGPELLNMYVGESERAVRAVFSRARHSRPCVIFFDEIDALCPKRTSESDGASSSRVVNQLLTEMDGLESRDCIMLAATNRPDMLDPAVLRPGRFDKIICVGLPTADDRHKILRTLTRNGTRPPLASDVDLARLAADPALEGFTGADLGALVRESSLAALKERILSGSQPVQGSGDDEPLKAEHESIKVADHHIRCALAKVRPSVPRAERHRYERLMSTFNVSSPPSSATLTTTKTTTS